MFHAGSNDSGASVICNTTPLKHIVSFLVGLGCEDLTGRIPSIDTPVIAPACGGACDVYKWWLRVDSLIDVGFLPIAVKTLRCSSQSNEETRLPKRAAKELFTWLRLVCHPNILPLLGLAIFHGRLSMISPWMSNGNLSAYLRKNVTPIAGRMLFCKQIRDGLLYIHNLGMAHGDLKPANIMVSDQGVAMITDFGNTFLKDLALLFAPTSNFDLTHRYAPPEHLIAATPVPATTQSDVYSYGMTILEILSGEMPFSGKKDSWVILQALQGTLSPSQPNTIDNHTWSMLLPCWAHDPLKRPSLSEFYLFELDSGQNSIVRFSGSQDLYVQCFLPRIAAGQNSGGQQAVTYSRRKTMAQCQSIILLLQNKPTHTTITDFLDFLVSPNFPNFSDGTQPINFATFDQLRRVEHAVRRCSFDSEAVATRSRIILAANILEILERSLNHTQGHRLIQLAEVLITEAHWAIKQFYDDSQRKTDACGASKALELMMGVILMEHFTCCSLSTVLSLVKLAAPVFRQACPDPPTELVNLPNVLLSGCVSAQNFAVIDILLSVTTARPTLIKYDTSYTTDTYRRLMGGECGFGQLYSIPGQFIVLFARINSLAEDYGPMANVDRQQVVRIEESIQEAKVGQSGIPDSDSVDMIRRMAVQECWRLTMYAYLHLVLCGVRADDPRVMEATKSFVRLFKVAKSNTKFSLFVPIVTIGAFLQKEDRGLIRDQLRDLREYPIPGISDGVWLQALAEVWEQTDFRQQAPGWSDLTMAYYSLIGV